MSAVEELVAGWAEGVCVVDMGRLLETCRLVVAVVGVSRGERRETGRSAREERMSVAMM